MSLFLMMFYWIGIPSFILWVARVLWRRTGVVLYKGLIAVASVAVLLGLLWLAAGEKWLLDRQVRELCAKDGGIRVYETVELPAKLVDKQGVIRIPDKAQAKSSDEYYYEASRKYYREGDPEMSRRQYRIVRRDDEKTLGELIFYGRGGGYLPGPWHGSSFTCPEPSQLPNFESSIFVKGDKK